MSWSISDLFPSWGDSGERPSDNFNYQGGDQVNEKHLDYLWYTVGELEDEVRSALEDIDSDSDGIVDGADTANLYKGNDIDSNGDGTVDNSDQFDGTAPSDGSAGDFLQTDGTSVSWGIPPTFPSDGIAMWSGSIANIPSGWVLCDGNNGTPNLQNRFVVGAGDQYSVGDTGGSDAVTLTESELASHNHSFDGYEPLDRAGPYNANTDTENEQLTNSTNNSGGDSAHENRPPYYALAYIMKV